MLSTIQYLHISTQYPQVGDLLGRVTGPPMSDKLAPRWPWYCAGLAGAGAAMLLLAAARDTLTVIMATLESNKS